jgi:hypothetical protein
MHIPPLRTLSAAYLDLLPRIALFQKKNILLLVWCFGPENGGSQNAGTVCFLRIGGVKGAALLSGLVLVTKSSVKHLIGEPRKSALCRTRPFRTGQEVCPNPSGGAASSTKYKWTAVFSPRIFSQVSIPQVTDYRPPPGRNPSKNIIRSQDALAKRCCQYYQVR